jgi:bifunctional non-homologous end joining protein LigD
MASASEVNLPAGGGEGAPPCSVRVSAFIVPLPRRRPSRRPAPRSPASSNGCLATLRTRMPAGSRYVHELELDGYRLQARLQDGRVTLYTRSGVDWTARFPAIAAEVARLPAGKLVIDGEVISADAEGRPSFSALQDDLKRRRHDRMLYYAFDLLYLDGFDPRAAPLLDRKRVLQSFLAEAAHASPDVIYSEHFKDGADFYAQACDMQLEGVVSKRVDAPYRSERTEDWIKVKCWRTGRFLVVGFVPGAGGMSALRLGRREGRRARLCRQGRHRLQSQVGCRRATATRAARTICSFA